MKSRSKLIFSLLIFPTLLLNAGCFGGSSPTAPGSGAGPGPFAGPEGHLEVDGSVEFGPTFVPGDVVVSEIGVARGVQYLAGDDHLVAVFFNTANLLVTKVGAVVATDTGSSAWDLDAGIGEPVSGVTIVADGDAWILQFNHTVLPAAPGTFGQLTLYGSLRTDL